jgi:AcrR family transcriptional regulator
VPVSRHFPTKESLFEAIIQDRVAHFREQARVLADEHPGDPGVAFDAFFYVLIGELAVDQGLADTIAGSGIDLTAAAAAAGREIGALLGRAQQAGVVRTDVEAQDVKALMMGCLADGRNLTHAALQRRVDVVCAGLRAR